MQRPDPALVQHSSAVSQAPRGRAARPRPPSLQDDEKAAQRAIGLFQVVAGLILLVGLLFAFVAESFASSLERLGQSDRPVRAETPVLAELLLPDTARRLPADPRLLAISGLSTVATGVALSLFDPQLGAEQERQLAAGDGNG